MRYLELRGDVDVRPDPDREVAHEVEQKYDADLRQMDAPGDERVAVTLRPTRVNAVDMTQG
jgi:hypothetical protein